MKTVDSIQVEISKTLVQAWLDLKQEEEALKEKKKKLSELINAQFNLNTNITNGEVYLVKQTDRTIKYDDETAIIAYLKRNRLTNFIKTTVNAPALNKELKNNTLLTEALKGFYHEEPVDKIVIKKA